MNNYVSFLLEAGAAEMRLARLFQSEELHPADHRSTTFATRDTSRATRTDTEQHSKLFRENRHQHELTYAQRRAAPPTRQPSQMKRDLTVSAFVLALVSVGVLLSAYTDQPTFWLLALKEAALKLGFVSEDQFDRVVDPAKMVKPYVAIDNR